MPGGSAYGGGASGAMGNLFENETLGLLTLHTCGRLMKRLSGETGKGENGMVDVPSGQSILTSWAEVVLGEMEIEAGQVGGWGWVAVMVVECGTALDDRPALQLMTRNPSWTESLGTHEVCGERYREIPPK